MPLIVSQQILCTSEGICDHVGHAADVGVALIQNEII